MRVSKLLLVVLRVKNALAFLRWGFLFMLASCYMSPTFKYENHWRPHRWEERPTDTIWQNNIPYERRKCTHDGCGIFDLKRIPFENGRFINH